MNMAEAAETALDPQQPTNQSINHYYSNKILLLWNTFFGGVRSFVINWISPYHILTNKLKHCLMLNMQQFKKRNDKYK